MDGESFFTVENFQLIARITQDAKEKKVIASAKPADFDSVPGTSKKVDTPGKKLSRRERRRLQFGGR